MILTTVIATIIALLTIFANSPNYEAGFTAGLIIWVVIVWTTCLIKIVNRLNKK